MDKMSLIKILLVTFPESLCSIYIAFFLTGDRQNLPFRDVITNRKNNIAKLLITVSLFSIIQYLGRRFSGDMTIFFIINMCLSVLTLKIVYNKTPHLNKDNNFLSNATIYLNTWKKPIIQVGIIFVGLASIENIYLPPVIHLLGNSSMKEVYTIPWVNLALPQIDRFFQILIITLLWDYQRINQNALNYEFKKPLFLLPFIYIVLIEFSFSYLYISSFSVLNSILKIAFFILITSMSICNVVFSKKALNIIDKIYLRHKKKGETSYEEKQAI